jgi:hypothetical protein
VNVSVLWSNVILFLVEVAILVVAIVVVTRAIRRHYS